VNGRLFRQTLRWQRARLAAVGLAAFGWGVLMPVIYSQFSDAIRDLANSGAIPDELLNFGSGSLFTLPGTVTLGFQHPLAIAFLGVFAVGAAATAVAGERARGTLEVLLARPIRRNVLYVSILVAMLLAVAFVLALILAGQMAGSAAVGLFDDLGADGMPLVFLNGFGLWASFTTFSLAASVTFDRPGPALGISLAWLLLHYFLEILGSLWTDAQALQEWSLLHHFNPSEILTGDPQPLDFAIVWIAAVIPLVYALYVFPQRDLAAPA
jgi:ABC-type transport system involved in multi-copper enzyme maturation permease subunit